MKMNKIINLIFALSAAVVITSCSSDSGGAAPAAPIGDITGSWSVNEESDATNCGEGIQVKNYTLNVTSQSGSAITYTSNGNTFNGTLAGNKLTSSGSYPEDGGTLTGNTTLTIGSTCSDFNGTASWSWTDGIESCAGTSTLTGTRINSTGCGNAVSVSDSESEPNDAVNVADILTAGVPMNGTTTSTAPEDDDYYVFTAPTAAKYRFTIDYDFTNSITMILADVNLQILITSFANTFESNTVISAGTTLYLQLDPGTTAGTIPYTLTVEAI